MLSSHLKDARMEVLLLAADASNKFQIEMVQIKGAGLNLNTVWRSGLIWFWQGLE